MACNFVWLAATEFNFSFDPPYFSNQNKIPSVLSNNSLCSQKLFYNRVLVFTTKRNLQI